jgi:PAS domain S-box-containing protein
VNILPKTPPPRLIRYGIAIGAAVAGLLVRLMLTAYAGEGLPTYILFYPAVILVALVFGLEAGLVATAASALLADYWLLHPHGRHELTPPAEAVGLVLFACMGVMISVAAEMYLRSRQKVAMYEKEAALRESEAKFRVLAEEMPHFVWETDAGGNATYQNAKWHSYTALTHEQTRNGGWVTVQHPDDSPRMAAAWARAIETGGEYDTHCRFRRASDGEYRWFHVKGAPIRDGAGAIVRWVGTCTDIHEQREAEEALRRSRDELETRVQERTAELRQSIDLVHTERQRLNDLLNVLPVYVALLSPDYHVPFANRFFEERFGKSHGKRCFEYLFGRTEPCEVCETFTVLKTLAPHRWEWTGPDSRTYDIFDFPFYEADGSRLIMEVGIDITERKQAEAALSEANEMLEQRVAERTAALVASEAQLRTIVESLTEGLVVASIEGELLYWNQAAMEMQGFAGADECPRRLPEFTEVLELSGMDGAVWPVEQWPLARILRGEHLRDLEARIRRIGSDWQRTFCYGGTTVKDPHGQPLLAIMTMDDITERKKSEEALRCSNENLEQFAYVASHDLQEPLRTMASFADLLESRYKHRLDRDADDFIDYIVDAAKRMQRLITDLLAYSRIGRPDALRSEVDCEAILSKVLTSIGPVIQESKAVITHDHLPILRGNESNVIQLFQNLVGNALKFRGPEAPRIHISAKKEHAYWLFSVRDNGIGIEDKYKDRVFLIFQRLHGKDKYAGTGIGLSICKKIVEGHGGAIWVESSLGKGSTFYFTMPA